MGAGASVSSSREPGGAGARPAKVVAQVPSAVEVPHRGLQYTHESVQVSANSNSLFLLEQVLPVSRCQPSRRNAH